MSTDQINDRLQLALNIVMMTAEVDGSYALNGSDLLLEVSTKEAPDRSLLPDEIRELMLGDQEFLFDYAHTTLMGDGMEMEHAADSLRERDGDDDLIEFYSRMFHDATLGVIGKLRALNNERINKILDEEN